MPGSDAAGTFPPHPPERKRKPAEARRARVRVLQKLLPLVIGSIALATVSGLYFQSGFLFAVLPALVLVLSFIVLLLQKCDVDGDTMYGIMIPLSALFGGKGLGEFGPADVVSAEIVRTRMEGYGTYTSLYVRSRFGGLAAFGGAPDMDEGELAKITDPAMREFLQDKLARERGDLALGLDWLQTQGIAVGLSTARGERLRARRYARWTMLGGVVGAVVVFAVLYVLQVSGFLAGSGIITPVTVGGFALVICVGAGLTMLDAGVAVWGDTIYRSRLPLRALVRPTALGEATAADVRSWRIRKPRLFERRDEQTVLEVRFRRRGKGIVYAQSDREAFKSVEKWLESRCPNRRKP